MMPPLPVSVLFAQVVHAMQLLAAIACLLIGLEHKALWRRGVIADIWSPAVLNAWWGWRRPLMVPAVFRVLPWVQIALAAVLMLASFGEARYAALSSVTAAALAGTLWLTALRFRGTVNGGSDGMLFTVLLGLAVATWPSGQTRVAQAGVLFVAAQVVLSYLRAGLVKARQPDWWNGEALRSFLAIPAYAVPTWVPQTPTLLRVVSVGVVLFELAAPVALLDARACLLYSAVAWCFHLATALVFGLNRFLLVWSAALPSVWFAVHLVQA